MQGLGNPVKKSHAQSVGDGACCAAKNKTVSNRLDGVDCFVFLSGNGQKSMSVSNDY